MSLVQANNVLIGVPDFSSFCEIEASSGFLTAWPASQLLRMLPTDRAQSTAASGTVNFTIDRGATVAGSSAGYAALGFSNMTSGATWRYRRGTGSDVAATTVYDSGTITFWASPGIGSVDSGQRHSFHRVTDGDNFRYERIDITDVGNADGFYRFGRYHSGSVFQPAEGTRIAGSEDPGYEDPTVRSVGPAGHVVYRAKNGSLAANFTISLHDRAEASALKNLLRKVGAHKDVLVVFEPNDNTYRHESMIFGTFTSPITTPIPVHGVYRFPLTIKGLV